MALTVTVSATQLVIVSNGTQIRFYGADVIEAKPIQKEVVSGVGAPQANQWFVELRLTGDARAVYGETYEIRLTDVSNQPTWTNSSKGAEDAAAAIAPMIRSLPPGGGGTPLDVTTNPGWVTIPDGLGPGVTGYIPITDTIT